MCQEYGDANTLHRFDLGLSHASGPGGGMRAAAEEALAEHDASWAFANLAHSSVLVRTGSADKFGTDHRLAPLLLLEAHLQRIFLATNNQRVGYDCLLSGASIKFTLTIFG